jgi:hypothetical protein
MQSNENLINLDELSVFPNGEPKPIFRVFLDMIRVYFPDQSELDALLENRLPITPDVSRRVSKLLRVIQGFDTNPLAFYDAQKNFDKSYVEWLKTNAKNSL